MAPAQHSRARLGGTGDGPQLADVLGEIAAAVTHLELLRERLCVGVLPAERDAGAIPPSTLVAVRQSCEQAARHSNQALAAMSLRSDRPVQSD